MTIRFIGDVHGNTRGYQTLVRNADKDGVATFQIGDMGMGFSASVPLDMGDQHRFIRGNHDDPALCRAHPAYAGDYGFDEKYNLFFLGGAFSIDWIGRQKYMRQGGKPVWWADEELSLNELDAAFELYRKSAPRIVATHECPASVAEELLLPMILSSNTHQAEYFNAKLGCKTSRTSVMLERMFEIHKPEWWVFGHYHVDWTREIRGAVFRCVAELTTTDIKI